MALIYWFLGSSVIKCFFKDVAATKLSFIKCKSIELDRIPSLTASAGKSMGKSVGKSAGNPVSHLFTKLCTCSCRHSVLICGLRVKHRILLLLLLLYFLLTYLSFRCHKNSVLFEIQMVDVFVFGGKNVYA